MFVRNSQFFDVRTDKPAKSAKPIPERELTDEDVAEKAAELFLDSTIVGLSDGNWKTRLAAVEQFNEVIHRNCIKCFNVIVASACSNPFWRTYLCGVLSSSQAISTMQSQDVQSQLLIRVLSKKPGFKDNNFQVLKLRLECLKTVVENFPITT